MDVMQIVKAMISDDMKLRIKKLVAIRQNQRMLRWKERMLPYQRGRYPYGINLIGDVRAETGLGQSVRLLASAMEHERIPFCINQVDMCGKLEHNVAAWEGKITDKPIYAVNLIHIIPGTWAVDYCKLGKEILDNRYNIAYWLWELETFPDYWKPCIETVDEIWTPSEFISNCIRRETEKPVVTVPYAIDVDSELGSGNMKMRRAEGDGVSGLNVDEYAKDMQRVKGNNHEVYFGRGYFGLPEEKFLFLTMYDFISLSERKNPEAVIEAYIKAFPKEDDETGLVIKVNHVEDRQLRQIKDKLKNYKNIYFITRNLTRPEVESLIKRTDVLVSLHRSEGFGLPVAEAMALGKPVVSTNWSSTAEFMDENCACPVKYVLTKLEKSVGPYEKGNFWAEADTGHAADYMKKLAQDRVYYERIGRNAKERIQGQLSYENAAGIMKDRVKAICGEDAV